MSGWDGPHVLLAVVVTIVVLAAELVVRGAIWKRVELQSARSRLRWIARLVWVYGLGLAAPVTGIYVGLAYALSSLMGPPSGLQIALVASFATISGLVVNVTKDLFLMHQKHGAVMAWLGREGLSLVTHEGRRAANWREAFVKKLPRWKDVDILVVTGINTIGASDALLSKYLKRPNPGRLRVLLLSPESEEFERRASRIGRARDAHFNATLATLARLERLRRRKSNVEYRFYDGNPIWRLYMGSGEAFFQHVAFSEEDANQPIYSIEEKDGSFYAAFSLYFETVWEGAKEDPGGETTKAISRLRQQRAQDEGSGLLDISRLDAEQTYRKAIVAAPDQELTEEDAFDFRREPDTDADLRIKKHRKARRNFDN